MKENCGSKYSGAEDSEEESAAKRVDRAQAERAPKRGARGAGAIISYSGAEDSEGQEPVGARHASPASDRSRSDPAERSSDLHARLVLASSSPRRVELLRCLGLGFDVVPSHVHENMEAGMPPEELVLDLALAKAREVAGLITSGKARVLESISEGATALGGTTSGGNLTFVLGADTIVVLDGEILGKPGSAPEAAAMLARLSGRCHQVYSGVAIVELPEDSFETGYQVSRVYFRPMLPEEIKAYVSTAEPMDKAGAYALQGAGSAFVERIEGCFTNIIGLPIPMVVQLLRRFGVSILGLP